MGMPLAVGRKSRLTGTSVPVISNKMKATKADINQRQNIGAQVLPF
jgi:hypothetical protein